MPDMPNRPLGATLDTLVCWAIANLADDERGPYAGEIQFYVAYKVGRVGIDAEDHGFYRSVSRSLDRLQEAGIITSNGGEGYTFVPIPEREGR